MLFTSQNSTVSPSVHSFAFILLIFFLFQKNELECCLKHAERVK